MAKRLPDRPRDANFVLRQEHQPAAEAWQGMTRLTLSVLLTNYNHAQYLPRALNAIVNQSRRPDEVLLLDDASSDDSTLIMRDYAAQYPFIKVVRNSKNMGCTASVIKATNLITGDYLHRAAADDYMLPGFCESLMAMAEANPGVGIISSALATVSDRDDKEWCMEGEVPRKNPWAETFGLPNCRSGYHSPEEVRRYHDSDALSPMASVAPATLYNRQLIKQLGGWPTDIGDAWECTFMLQAAGFHSGMAYTEEPLYTWVFRIKGITDRELADIRHMRRMCDRYAEKMNEPPFAGLFSERFAERWKLTANEHLESNRQALLRNRSRLKKIVSRMMPWRSEYA